LNLLQQEQIVIRIRQLHNLKAVAAAVAVVVAAVIAAAVVVLHQEGCHVRRECSRSSIDEEAHEVLATCLNSWTMVSKQSYFPQNFEDP